MKKAFGAYLTPEMAKALSEGACSSQLPKRDVREIDFVFVSTVAPDAATYSERAGVVVEAASQCEGMVHHIVPFVVVGFGIVFPSPPDARQRLVEKLGVLLPNLVSAVHGKVTASIGSYGSESRFDFGFWWPQATEAMRQLSELSPGEIREFRPIQ